ncbi:MAG: hypothetical protein JO170_10955 [Verrucomicrobia bacterium]|nr:hypothetical protein [Verrucomicrobiota bacterium]
MTEGLGAEVIYDAVAGPGLEELVWATSRSVERTGESVQLFVFREQEGLVAIEAFQNTRLRPVTDAQSAEVWRQFDQLWNNRGR